jgi:hypothetical protein
MHLRPVLYMWLRREQQPDLHRQCHWKRFLHWQCLQGRHCQWNRADLPQWHSRQWNHCDWCGECAVGRQGNGSWIGYHRIPPGLVVFDPLIGILPQSEDGIDFYLAFCTLWRHSFILRPRRMRFKAARIMAVFGEVDF